MTGSLHDWDSLVPTLASLVTGLLQPDLPGHGKSVIPENPAFYTAENVLLAFGNWLISLKDSPPYI